MRRSKAEVDRYISSVQSSSPSLKERPIKGFLFAKLYLEAKEYDLAKRHVSEYLKIQARDSKAHKFLGQLFEKEGEINKAVGCYKRSVDLNPAQKDLVLKVAELLCSNEQCDSRAECWVEMAAKLLPGHPAVFDLKEKLLSRQGQQGWNRLFDLLQAELAARPSDTLVNVKLVQLYCKDGRLNEAIKHCLTVEQRGLLRHSLDWYTVMLSTLQEYLAQPNFAANNNKESRRLQRELLLAHCNLLRLTLSGRELKASLDALKCFDQAMQALSSTAGSQSDDLSEVFVEMKGHLYLHTATSLLKMAQEGKQQWRVVVDLAALCYLLAYQAPRPTPKVSKGDQTAYQLVELLASDRQSQAGHMLFNLTTDIDTLVKEVVEAFGNRSSQCTLYELLFVPHVQTDEDPTKEKTDRDHTGTGTSFIANDDICSLKSQSPKLLDLAKLDNGSILLHGGDLQHLSWLGLQWAIKGQRASLRDWLKQLFPRLTLETSKLDTNAPESICLLDLEVFVCGVVFCSHSQLQDKARINSGGHQQLHEPRCMPLPLLSLLCVAGTGQEQDNQLPPLFTDSGEWWDPEKKWWDAVYSLIHKRAPPGMSAKLRMIVQHGLSTLRAREKHGLQPALVIHWAQHLSQMGMAVNSYHEQKEYASRSDHYWKVVLPLLHKIKHGCSIPKPLYPLFKHFPSKDIQISALKGYEEEAMISAATLLDIEGKRDEAIAVLEPINNMSSTWLLAQIYQRLSNEAGKGVEETQERCIMFRKKFRTSMSKIFSSNLNDIENLPVSMEKLMDLLNKVKQQLGESEEGLDDDDEEEVGTEQLAPSSPVELSQSAATSSPKKRIISPLKRHPISSKTPPHWGDGQIRPDRNHTMYRPYTARSYHRAPLTFVTTGPTVNVTPTNGPIYGMSYMQPRPKHNAYQQHTYTPLPATPGSIYPPQDQVFDGPLHFTEQLAIPFKTADEAALLKTKFAEAQKIVPKLPENHEEQQKKEPEPTKCPLTTFGALVAVKEGEWDCVRNNATTTKYVANQSDDPDSSSRPDRNGAIGLTAPVAKKPAPAFASFKFEAQPSGVSASGFISMPISSGGLKCGSQDTGKETSATEDPTTAVPAPTSGSASMFPNIYDQHREKEKETFISISTRSVEETNQNPIFTVQPNTFSFSDLAKSTGDLQFGQKNPNFKGFPRAGEQVFKTEEDDDIPDKIDLVTWLVTREEDEQVLYSQDINLFRFDPATKSPKSSPETEVSLSCSKAKGSGSPASATAAFRIPEEVPPQAERVNESDGGVEVVYVREPTAENEPGYTSDSETDDDEDYESAEETLNGNLYPDPTEDQAPVQDPSQGTPEPPQTLSEEASAPKALGQETPEPQALVLEAPAPQVPSQETPEPQGLVQEAPAPQVPAKENPEPQDLGQETPEPQTLGQEVPEPQALAQEEVPEPQTLLQEGPKPLAVGRETPDPQTLGQNTPQPHTLGQETPERPTLGEDFPEQQALGQEVPEPQTLDQEAPEKQTLRQDILEPQALEQETESESSTTQEQSTEDQSVAPISSAPLSMGEEVLAPKPMGQETPEPLALVQEAPAPHVPSQETPEPQALGQEDVPEPQTPLQEGPKLLPVGGDTPEPQTLCQNTPEPQTPSQNTLQPQTLVQETPERQTLDEDVPERQALGQEVPEPQTLGQEAPEEQAPSQDTMAPQALERETESESSTPLEQSTDALSVAPIISASIDLSLKKTSEPDSTTYTATTTKNIGGKFTFGKQDSSISWMNAPEIGFGASAPPAPKNGGEQEGSNKEEASNNVDINFEPIVSLQKVETKSGQKTPEPQTLGQETPEPLALVQEAPAPQVPFQETPEPQALGQEDVPEPQTPLQEGPKLLAVGGETPEPQTLCQNTPEPQTLGQNTLQPQTLGQETPERQTLDEDVPERQALGQEVPEPQTLGQGAPEEQAPSQETMAPKALDQETESESSTPLEQSTDALSVAPIISASIDLSLKKTSEPDSTTYTTATTTKNIGGKFAFGKQDSSISWMNAPEMVLGASAPPAPKNGGEEEGSDKEEASNNEDINFEPIVSLQKVETKFGQKTPEPQTLGQETLERQTLGEEVLAPKVMGQGTPEPLALVQEAPSPQVPSQETPEPQALGQEDVIEPQTPLQEGPKLLAVGGETPEPQTLCQNTPEPQTLGQNTLQPQTLGQETPERQTLDEDVPEQQALGQEVPEPQTLGQEAPEEQAPSQETMAPQALERETESESSTPLEQSTDALSVAPIISTSIDLSLKKTSEPDSTTYTTATTTKNIGGKFAFGKQDSSILWMNAPEMVLGASAPPAPKNGREEEGSNKEGASNNVDINCEPIVSLQKVETKSGQKTPEPQTLGQETLERQTLGEEVLAPKVMGHETPEPLALVHEAPVPQVPSQETPEPQTLCQNTPEPQTQTPERQTLDEDVPERQALGQEVPEPQTLGQEAPEEQAPSHETMAPQGLEQETESESSTPLEQSTDALSVAPIISPSIDLSLKKTSEPGSTTHTSVPLNNGEEEDGGIEEGAPNNADIHFEPNVLLPEVQTKSGEEDEEILFKERTSMGQDTSDLSYTHMSRASKHSRETNPLVFLTVAANGQLLGTITIELFFHIVPKTAENFRALCTREKGFRLQNSIFHKVIPDFMCQGGDITNHDGTGGQSIYGSTFEDENFDVRHTSCGLLSMANRGRNTNNSQFYITLTKTEHLDSKHVVFGWVRERMDVVKQMGALGTKSGKPSKRIVITDCGQL